MIVVRLYETHNQRGAVRLEFAYPVKQIIECNLIEEDLKEFYNLADDTFDFYIKPYEIKTFKILFNHRIQLDALDDGFLMA